MSQLDVNDISGNDTTGNIQRSDSTSAPDEAGAILNDESFTREYNDSTEMTEFEKLQSR